MYIIFVGNFLEGILSRKIFFVVWNDVCYFIIMGGLNIKNYVILNKVVVYMQIQNVFLKKDIMWVKWIDDVFFEGEDFQEYVLWKNIVYYRRKLNKVKLKKICLRRKVGGRFLYNKKFYWVLL